MGFSRFSALLAIRFSLILAALTIVGVLIVTPGYHAGTLLAVLITLGLCVEVFGFISKTNQELSRFLDATRYADFGQRFDFAAHGAGFKELGETFTHILDRFREVRNDQEQELRHLKALFEHVPVPLISLHMDDSVTIWNNAARRLFGSNTPARVDDFVQFGEAFFERVKRLKAGDQVLVVFVVDDMEHKLTISASELQLGGKSERLVSLQNIQSELDGAQLGAWQDLVRVLTHEIMNSITPVASLAKTAVDLVDDAVARIPPELGVLEELVDARDAVETVARRSDNLMDFVSSYRQLTRLPDPDRSRIMVRELFDDVKKLSAAKWQELGISVASRVEPVDLEVFADRNMIEQVVINILHNAENALENADSPTIMLAASLNRRGRIVIEVCDNGPGISEAVATKIFVPFFTTRREGSGVGLALSRQIMLAHGGAVSFNNIETGGARFSLVF